MWDAGKRPAPGASPALNSFAGQGLRLISGTGCELTPYSLKSGTEQRYSDTRVILDTDGRAMAVLVGQPCDDPTWGPSAARAGEALLNVRTEGLARGAFRAADLDHRRGKFLAVASGVSFGGGQTVRGFFFDTPLKY